MDEITRVVGEALQATEAARGLDSDDFVDNAATILHRSRSIFRRRRRRNRALPSLPGNLPTDSVTDETRGRKRKSTIQISVCLLGKCNDDFVPPLKELQRLQRNKLCRPIHELPNLMDRDYKKTVIQRSMPLQAFDDVIVSGYPDVPLRYIGFEYAYADKGRRLHKITNVHSVSSLIGQIHSGKLYVIPKRDIQLPLSTDTNRPTGAAEDHQFFPPEEQNIVPSIENEEIHLQSVEQNIVPSIENEEIHLQSELRQSRADSLPIEPADGFRLVMILPNERHISRNFAISSKMKDIMNFVGSQPEARMNFGIVISGSRTKYTYENVPDITLEELGVTQPSIIHVTWMDQEHSQSRACTVPAGDASEDTGTPTVSFRPPRRQAANVARLRLHEWTSGRARSTSPQRTPPERTPPPRSPTPPPRSPTPPPCTSSDVRPFQSDESETQSQSQVTTKALLQTLQDAIIRTESPTSNMINVLRGSVMDGAVRAFQRRSFDPKHKISVVFMDEAGTTEGAVDDGGPSREFFRLLLNEIRISNLFVGPDYSKYLELSTTALEKKLYKTLGAMIGVSLCHGGPPPNFFAEEFYHLLVGIEVKPQCHLIYNQEIKDQIGKIKQAPTLEAAREAAADAETLLAVAGSFRYITSDEQRDKLVDETLQFFLIDRLRAPIDQFRSGLAESGVLRMMENYPDLMKTLFLQSESVLKASDLINLFNPQFSSRGHIKFDRETAVCGYWRDWLLDVEDANSSVTLEEILIFATGASTIPPLGFPMKASLNFLHAEDFPFGVKYPLANTCTLTLSLPVELKYEDFCTDMEDGIGQCTQFGFA